MSEIRFEVYFCGYCSQCGEYVAPGFGRYKGDACPHCGKPLEEKSE